MPPPAILSLDALDPTRVVHSREEIYRVLPQRHEFEQLDAIIHVDLEGQVVAAIRNVKPDEWWCRGHMPGQPIFPGVLMVEAAAQLAAFTQTLIIDVPKGQFLGFGGIDGTKFRGSVVPPAQIILIGRATEVRSRRFGCAIQSYVNDTMVFEGNITGLMMQLEQ